jgi:AAA domain
LRIRRPTVLEYLHLKNVGPAPEMEMELAPRLNLITGDNGLGKSFLLDVAWWALTRKWPQDSNKRLTSGYAARPTEITKPATIEFRVTSKSKSVTYESRYVSNWLTSEAFDLGEPTSIEAEESPFVARELRRQGRLNVEDR